MQENAIDITLTLPLCGLFKKSRIVTQSLLSESFIPLNELLNVLDILCGGTALASLDS
jgi:hypothetical protein